MNKILKNTLASAEIAQIGAELVSFRLLEDHCEYIWTGDPKYWSGHSPLLFPMVCAANGDEIRIDGVKYGMSNHGFARNMEFEILEESDSSLVYGLKYCEDTLKMYPFKFMLTVAYVLIDKQIEIRYKVENQDNKKIYFQIGTHPGFQCPIDKNCELEDYYIEFNREEKFERMFLNEQNVRISKRFDTVMERGKILPLTHGLFDEGAHVYQNINSDKITLKSNKSSKQVSLSYSNLPYLGLWQVKNAPYICIEPWQGMAETDVFQGEFKEKEGIITLKPSEYFECNLTIEIT